MSEAASLGKCDCCKATGQFQLTVDRGKLFAETATAAMTVSKGTDSSTAPTNSKPVDVQTLMKSDPRFIARLIQQLDSQMHNMQDEKKRRQLAVKEDTDEMQRIVQEIKLHIQPGIVEYFTIHRFSGLYQAVCLK